VPGVALSGGGNLAHHRTLLDQIVVVRVRADPEPEHAIVNLDGEGAMMKADASRPIGTDRLEMQRRVLRVLLQ
jgi:hypothetical protein